MKISICVATRGRAPLMERLYESILTTTKDLNNVELVFCVDDDDPKSIAMLELLSTPDSIVNGCIVNEKEVILAEKWNKCWEISSGEVFMLCDDDIIFRTKGWDVEVRNAFVKYPDRIVFVYGRDTPNHPWGNKGTHGFIHKNWADTVGYFVPPYFRTWYVDRWLNNVAEIIDRRCYLKDVYTEHMHIGRNLAPMDDTYLRGSHGEKGDVRKIWSQKQPELREDAEKLRKFIENFKKV